MKLTLKLTIILLVLANGCARFSTRQTDKREEFNENGSISSRTTITTKATGTAFFDSKSTLATWRAEQSEGQQGAEVGDLNQESYGTNVTKLATSVAEVVVRAIKGIP